MVDLLFLVQLTMPERMEPRVSVFPEPKLLSGMTLTRRQEKECVCANACMRTHVCIFMCQV